MVGNPIYVPIVKGKEGEFAALEALYEDARSGVTPLIELAGVPFDYVNDRPAKELHDHLSGVAERLKKAWGTGREMYVDIPWAHDEEVLADGRVAIDAVLEDCRASDLTVVPVITRNKSSQYVSAVARHAPSNVCLRLMLDDFAEEVDLDSDLNRIVATIGLEAAAVDLVLDLGDLGKDGRDLIVARYALGAVPRVEDWRRVILAAASFPEDLSAVDAATVRMLPRREWLLWTTLQRKPKQLQRPDLIYSDYGIAHPVPRELDPRVMRMSASIRYTTAESWLVVKGRNVRQFGFEQYFELARTLTQRAEYSGAGFSWGDSYIAQCAAGTSGPGNATTWRKVGTNHHISFVVSQLANRFAF
jgi:hypothetical protein